MKSILVSLVPCLFYSLLSYSQTKNVEIGGGLRTIISALAPFNRQQVLRPSFEIDLAKEYMLNTSFSFMPEIKYISNCILLEDNSYSTNINQQLFYNELITNRALDIQLPIKYYLCRHKFYLVAGVSGQYKLSVSSSITIRDVQHTIISSGTQTVTPIDSKRSSIGVLLGGGYMIGKVDIRFQGQYGWNNFLAYMPYNCYSFSLSTRYFIAR